MSAAVILVGLWLGIAYAYCRSLDRPSRGGMQPKNPPPPPTASDLLPSPPRDAA